MKMSMETESAISRWQKPDALLEEETSDSDDPEHPVRSVISRIVGSSEHENRVTVFEMKMSMETELAISRWQKPDALLEEETSNSDDPEHPVRSVISRIVGSSEHENRVTVFEMKMSMETEPAMSR